MEKLIATLEEDVLTSVIDRLRMQNAKLQAKVDQEGEKILKNIYTMDLDSALQAVDSYNYDWFDSCLYSDSLKRSIAIRLLDETKNYPVDNTVWQQIAQPMSGENI
jgi:hypothetical protein